jgi:mRNA-degrading endonuclease RelE of RelBE toxin-antitoxin system
MVDVTEFKEKVTEIISQDYKIDFLGDDFDKTIDRLSETKAEKIYAWVREVVENNIAPIMKNARDKKYKGIPLNEILSFRKEIQVAGSDHRIMLIKIKSEHYIEFHIGQHKYYDRLRKNLGLTKKDY